MSIESLSMGKYGVYVWSAYGVALILLLAHFVYSRFLKRRMLRQLRQWYAEFR